MRAQYENRTAQISIAIIFFGFPRRLFLDGVSPIQ